MNKVIDMNIYNNMIKFINKVLNNIINWVTDMI